MTFARAAGALIVALALAIFLSPGAIGLAESQGPVAGLILLAIGFWATGALPFHLTALALLLLATVLELAPPRVIFAGFASSALWLIFGGLVIGNAVQATGLGRRLARLLVGLLGGSYRRIVYGTVGLGVALAFLVPAAMGRIMILVPIFVALTGELGLGRGQPARTGVLLAAAFGTILPAFAILPANLPNMVLLGVAETLYGVSPSYGSWLLLHFPVLGLLHALLLAELICRLFPGTVGARSAAPRDPLPPWRAAEIRLLAILLLALALWATDSIHGVSPGWVALAAALACMLPGIGVLDARAFESATSFSTFFYVAGVLGMVSLFDASGLADVIGAHALRWLPLAPDAPATNFAALVGAAAVDQPVHHASGRRGGARPARGTAGGGREPPARDGVDDSGRGLRGDAAALPVGAGDGRAAARGGPSGRRQQAQPAARHDHAPGPRAAQLPLVAMARLPLITHCNRWIAALQLSVA